MILRWKLISSVAGAVAAVLGVIVAAPKAIEAIDESGFPTIATREYTRSQIAHDREANIVIRDALINLTVIRRNWLARERDDAKSKIASPTIPDDARRAWLENLEHHQRDLDDVDETLTTLKRLRRP